MNRIKTHRINYYILLSVLIHSFLFLFTEKEKDITLGKKIIPIEVVDNLLEAGFGESTKRNNKLIKRTSLKEESKKEKKKKPIDKKKSTEDSIINKNIKERIVEQNKAESKNINETISKENKVSGSREGIKTNEPEKGSLRGKGIIKVTCLKCVLPIYPPIALRRGAEGTPVVKVWINRKGIVIKEELITKSGNEQIDKATLNAAKNSVFYPIQRETSINIEYELRIKTE